MASTAFFGFGIPHVVLDEEFDAPDISADRELCRAIAAGRMGLHPDAWGNHHSMAGPLLPARIWDGDWTVSHEPPISPEEQAEWEAKHRRPGPPQTGIIELTCDECRKPFGPQLAYGSGQRDAMAAGLRALGGQEGWTHIAGRDRCPACSSIPAPDDIGQGAGEGERDKQHADGC